MITQMSTFVWQNLRKIKLFAENSAHHVHKIGNKSVLIPESTSIQFTAGFFMPMSLMKAVN